MKAKVRIAVAVDSDGEWNSTGWGNLRKPPSSDDVRQRESLALEPLGSVVKTYWVEVEIEAPEPTVVQATATPS